jgi:hypothetical protein
MRTFSQGHVDGRNSRCPPVATDLWLGDHGVAATVSYVPGERKAAGRRLPCLAFRLARTDFGQAVVPIYGKYAVKGML